MPTSALVNLRRSNKAAVIYKLMSQGEMSRLSLSKELNLTSSSLTHIVKELIDEGLVIEHSSVETGKRGRREILLQFDSKKYVALGINIESDNTHISLANYLDVISEDIVPTKDLFLDGIDKLASKILDLINKYTDFIFTGACVGICGKVDAKKGISINSFSILPDMFNIKDELYKKTGLTIDLVNNVKAQATSLITEKNSNFLFVKHSPGIGCAMVEGGHVVDGSSDIAGELGHTTVQPNGLKCRCGKIGCLEAYSSEQSIVEQYNKRTKTNKDISEIYSLYKTDSVAKEILDIATSYIALSISNASVLLNPERIILTGGIFFDNDLLKIITDKIKDFGCNTEIQILSNEYKIKAFAEARYILIKELFEVQNEKEN